MKIKKEIHVIGLQRSGLHGVCNWILGHFGDSIFRNDATLKLFDGAYGFNYFSNGECVSKRNAEMKPCEAIILDHENQTPDFFENYTENPKYLESTLETEEKYIVLNLRDCYNNFASLYKMFGKVELIRIDIWKDFAKEYIGQTSFLKSDKFDLILLNYNRWFVDIEYRKEISQQLGVEFNDRNINKMLTYGGGSSFSQTAHINDAQQLNVLNRWQQYQNDEYFKNLFDEELCQLTKEIFGIENGL